MGRLLQKKGPQWPFQACKPILDQADLVVANLESPVGKGGEKYTKKSVYLRGKTKDLDALAYGGIGLVTLANNHILDYGPKVMKQTVKGLEERGILYTGLAPEGGVAQEPIFVQVQGVTLAFLGFCSVCPGSSTLARTGRAWKWPCPRSCFPRSRKPKPRPITSLC